MKPARDPVALDMNRFTYPCLLLLAVALSSGCYFHGGTVYSATPHPRLNLPHHDQKIALRLSPKIPSDFEPRDDVQIYDFRNTLIRGFREGFGAAFALGDDHPDLVVEIDMLDLWFETVATENNHDVHGTYYDAHIRFRVRLHDKNGDVVATYAGEARSKGSEVGAEAITISAIESMYEQIGDKLFWS